MALRKLFDRYLSPHSAWADFLYGPFWGAVGRNPDLALGLLGEEPGCIVDGPRAEGFLGPFFVLDSRGERHRVYFSTSLIDDIQSKVCHELESAESGHRER